MLMGGPIRLNQMNETKQITRGLIDLLQCLLQHEAKAIQETDCCVNTHQAMSYY